MDGENVLRADGSRRRRYDLHLHLHGLERTPQTRFTNALLGTHYWGTHSTIADRLVGEVAPRRAKLKQVVFLSYPLRHLHTAECPFVWHRVGRAWLIV